MRVVNGLSIAAAACALMLPQTSFAQAEPQQQSKPTRLLVPRRVYHAITLPVSGSGVEVSHLSTTPTTLAAHVSDYDKQDGIRVFDRKTGKERWRRQTTRMAEKPAAGAIAIEWNLLGVVARAGADDVVVAACREVKNIAKRDGERRFAYHAQLQGLAARTGRPIWHVPISDNQLELSNLTMRGSMVVLPPCLAVSAKQDEEPPSGYTLIGTGAATGPFSLIEGATGRPIGVDTPQGRAYLSQQIKEVNAHVVPIRWGNIMHLDTGLITKEVEPSGNFIGGYISLVACSDDRNLMLFNHDDGETGHSSWPRFVYGTDAAGKVLWMFNEECAFSVGALWRLGIMLVVTDSSYGLWGVRTADGKVLWRYKEGDVKPPLAMYGNGGFVLTENRGTPKKRLTLVWVSAQDGRGQTVGELDAANLTDLSGMGMGGVSMQVLDNTLFVIDDLGDVREYACADLLAPRKGVAATPRERKRVIAK